MPKLKFKSLMDSSGHVFHTACISRWLDQNNNCSQCREGCEIRQIIKLFFSENPDGLEGNITNNQLEQKSLELEQKSLELEQKSLELEQKRLELEQESLKLDQKNLKSVRELNNMKRRMLEGSNQINQANQKCQKLEEEKLLMKLDWSKTEWNLKGIFLLWQKKILSAMAIFILLRWQILPFSRVQNPEITISYQKTISFRMILFAICREYFPHNPYLPS